MKLKDLGERKILRDIIFRYINSNKNELGIDEDAVALRINDLYLVLNVDTFVRETDAPPGMTEYQMGYRIITMTISDLLSKGALPSSVLLSISAPDNMEIDKFRALLIGISDACKKYHVSYLGGDFGESKDLVLSGVGIGTAERLIYRNSALPGDTVWVTGPFGFSGAALHYLLSGGKGNKEILDQILQNYFYSPLKLNDGKALHKVASAAMDSSDGLAFTLNTIAEKSKVKIEINKIPISKPVLEYARINNLDPVNLALYSGEEFEIVFTVRGVSDYKVRKVFRELNARDPIRIGVVTEGVGVYYRGERVSFKGWEHFR